MKDHTIAYMAGLIDTDGTIGIYYRGESGYQASLEFYNDSKSLMEWVVFNFGGTYKSKLDKRRSTLGYRWAPQSREHLIKFLEIITPYLLLKKVEVEVIIQFLELSGDCPDVRKYLCNTCKFLKGKRNFVETDTLRNFLQREPNLIQAYVAGLIDGDGNIDVYENSNPLVVIGFTNMCIPLINALISLYGGGKYRCKFTTWRWQLTGMKFQESFLLKVIPYLEFKKEKAINALEQLRLRINKVRKFGAPCKEFMIQSELHSDM